MKKTLSFVLVAVFATAACSKTKTTTTGPSNKTDMKAGGTGGATYGTPNTTTTTTTTTTPTATPNPCGGM